VTGADHPLRPIREDILERRAKPTAISVDNGTESARNAIDVWAYRGAALTILGMAIVSANMTTLWLRQLVAPAPESHHFAMCVDSVRPHHT
jgi:hypothetical protein